MRQTPKADVEMSSWVVPLLLQLLVMPFLKKRIDRAYETIDK